MFWDLFFYYVGQWTLLGQLEQRVLRGTRMLLTTLFIIGHMEIGNGVCRTDMMINKDPISMEYPCEYYSELHNLDKQFIQEK